jgi:hypothetical protein
VIILLIGCFFCFCRRYPTTRSYFDDSGQFVQGSPGTEPIPYSNSDPQAWGSGEPRGGGVHPTYDSPSSQSDDSKAHLLGNVSGGNDMGTSESGSHSQHHDSHSPYGGPSSSSDGTLAMLTSTGGMGSNPSLVTPLPAYFPFPERPRATGSAVGETTRPKHVIELRTPTPRRSNAIHVAPPLHPAVQPGDRALYLEVFRRTNGVRMSDPPSYYSTIPENP